MKRSVFAPGSTDIERGQRLYLMHAPDFAASITQRCPNSLHWQPTFTENHHPQVYRHARPAHAEGADICESEKEIGDGERDQHEQAKNLRLAPGRDEQRSDDKGHLELEKSA